MWKSIKQFYNRVEELKEYNPSGIGVACKLIYFCQIAIVCLVPMALMREESRTGAGIQIMIVLVTIASLLLTAYSSKKYEKSKLQQNTDNIIKDCINFGLYRKKDEAKCNCCQKIGKELYKQCKQVSNQNSISKIKTDCSEFGKPNSGSGECGACVDCLELRTEVWEACYDKRLGISRR